MPRRDTFAAWLVRRAGLRALSPCIDLILLWSFARAAGEAGSVDQVRRYGERTHWGSEAKFYRSLKLWRESTGMDTPALLLAHVELSKERKRAAAQLLSVTMAEVS